MRQLSARGAVSLRDKVEAPNRGLLRRPEACLKGHRQWDPAASPGAPVVRGGSHGQCAVNSLGASGSRD